MSINEKCAIKYEECKANAQCPNCKCCEKHCSCTKRWDGICTHKDGDPSLGQQSAPCPYHDAIAFCLSCSQFLYTNEDLKKHTSVEIPNAKSYPYYSEHHFIDYLKKPDEYCGKCLPPK